MNTICQHSSAYDKYNTVAFPYDCQKFIQCNGTAFAELKTVSNDRYYNPTNGQAVPSMACATLKGMSQLMMHNRSRTHRNFTFGFSS